MPCLLPGTPQGTPCRWNSLESVGCAQEEGGAIALFTALVFSLYNGSRKGCYLHKPKKSTIFLFFVFFKGSLSSSDRDEIFSANDLGRYFMGNLFVVVSRSEKKKSSA